MIERFVSGNNFQYNFNLIETKPVGLALEPIFITFINVIVSWQFEPSFKQFVLVILFIFIHERLSYVCKRYVFIKYILSLIDVTKDQRAKVLFTNMQLRTAFLVFHNLQNRCKLFKIQVHPIYLDFTVSVKIYYKNINLVKLQCSCGHLKFIVKFDLLIVIWCRQACEE